MLSAHKKVQKRFVLNNKGYCLHLFSTLYSMKLNKAFQRKQKTYVETFFVNNYVFPVDPDIDKEVCIALKLYRKPEEEMLKTFFWCRDREYQWYEVL